MRLLIPILFSLPLASALSGVIRDANAVNNQVFDYVIVGGGLGGFAVAGRLSEDPGVSVLVIEAGGDTRQDPVVSDSTQYPNVYGRDDLWWKWRTTDGKEMMGGKMLGGSTGINGMTYTRGQKEQYDALAQLLGGDSNGGRWTWDGMFAAMKKAESFSPPNDEQRAKGANYNPDYHGYSGPVQVTFPSKMYGQQMKAFHDVCATNFSIPHSDDPAGGSAAVVGFVPNTINWRLGDRRSSSVEAYYTPVETTRTNLAVLINNRATKIHTEGSNDNVRTVGVEFASDANAPRLNVWVSREVIVAAGAMQTPALLQLSGIGERSHLESLGVNVVVDLPGVGKNLQEQTQSAIGWSSEFVENIQSLSGLIAYPDMKALFGNADKAAQVARSIWGGIKQWAADAAAAGALVSASAGEALFNVQADLMINKGVGLVELFFNNGYPNGGLGVTLWNLLPFARGSVRIASADPFAPLRVETRAFSTEADKTMQIQGARMTRQIFKSAPLRNLVTEENQPAAEVPDDDNGGSDENWWNYISKSWVNVNHPIATCSMMLESYGGVVDGNLRVYHTQNLRIVDASVLPHQLSAHLSATLYGLAENAADIIKSGRWVN